MTKPALWILSGGAQCCFSLMALVLHYSANAPAFTHILIFRRKHLRYGMQLCFCIIHCIFIFFSSLPRRGSKPSANSRCFVPEVTGEYIDFNLGQSLHHRLRWAAQASWTKHTGGISSRSLACGEAVEASGLCTGAKSVGCYWYSISSVTPKLLCIQKLCSKLRVSSLRPVKLTARPAVLFHKHHGVLYYLWNKSVACAALGVFHSWHFNSASFIWGGAWATGCCV